MKTQLSFIHNDVKYITLFGANDYLQGLLEAGGNAAPAMKILTSSAYSHSFKSVFGIEARKVPVMQDTEVTQNGNTFIVKGKVLSADGKSHDAEITALGIKIDGEYVDAEEKKEPEPEPTPEPEPEPTPEPEPDPTPAPAPEPTSEPESANETTNTTEKKELYPAGFTTSADTRNLLDIPENVGFVIGEVRSKVEKPLLIGGRSNNSFGFYSKESMYTARSNKTPVQPAPAPVPEEPTEAPAETEELYVEEAKAESPFSSTPKSAKERLRDQMSPEINAVIGDIPHSLLGDVSKFSMEDIDEDALKSKGVVYCIDNDWERCGNWFCIDVIPKSCRHFFNVRLGVNIEIPVSLCKKWLKAVK